jgi:hypothetical protein
MSHGPGKIEQAISAAFEAHPDSSFTIGDLARIAFPEASPVDKRHRVSVRRAARKVVNRGRWCAFNLRTGRREVAYCNLDSEHSFAEAWARLLDPGAWARGSKRDRAGVVAANMADSAMQKTLHDWRCQKAA